MFRVSILFILLVALVVTLIFVYRLIYTHNINKKIQSGEIQGRKMMDLSRMVTIAVIIGLILYSGIVTYVVNDYANQESHVLRNNYAIIDVSNPDKYEYAGYFGSVQLKDASYAKMYNKDENTGYEKEVVTSGDYVFTVFTRSAPADSFHPDFLCFVEYIGADKEKYVCYDKAGFQAIGEEEDQFFAGSAGNISDGLLYIGYLEEGHSFQISMSLLDQEAEKNYMEAEELAYKEDKGQFPEVEDFAVSVGSVDIQILD